MTDDEAKNLIIQRLKKEKRNDNYIKYFMENINLQKFIDSRKYADSLNPYEKLILIVLKMFEHNKSLESKLKNLICMIPCNITPEYILDDHEKSFNSVKIAFGHLIKQNPPEIRESFYTDEYKEILEEIREENNND